MANVGLIMDLNPKFWLDRRVFVTGATGLLGSWLSAKLVALGADVVVLIRDWVPESELFQNNSMSGSTVIRPRTRRGSSQRRWRERRRAPHRRR